MTGSAKGRLAKQCAALIVKIGRWERGLAANPDLQPGLDLMRAQLLAARAALESNSPLGIVKAMGELDDYHTDLGC